MSWGPGGIFPCCMHFVISIKWATRFWERVLPVSAVHWPSQLQVREYSFVETAVSRESPLPQQELMLRSWLWPSCVWLAGSGAWKVLCEALWILVQCLLDEAPHTCFPLLTVLQFPQESDQFVNWKEETCGKIHVKTSWVAWEHFWVTQSSTHLWRLKRPSSIYIWQTKSVAKMIKCMSDLFFHSQENKTHAAVISS